ncbi:MAG: hypothetical protein Q9168_007392 [Polycauliona sp. 1 TL-2023]
MTSISIYAELLLNIRQITVVVSLPSAYSNDATVVQLSEDRQSLCVFHDGQSVAVKLPAAVPPGFNPTVAPGSTNALSFRLPIIANDLLSPTTTSTHAPKFLWSAASMAPTTWIACRFCRSLLVKEQVGTWKDLPSENWAEMMDFWHCHKPDVDDEDHDTQKQDGVGKGYGAGSMIRPTSGVGLVDVISLHLVQPDCNITVGDEPMVLKNGNRQLTVDCASCKHPVGIAADNGPRLYKWNICFQSDPQHGWEEHSAHKLVAAQLLAMIENQGVQKFVLQSELQDDDCEALFVWILTPNMYFSSTLASRNPKQVMKLYYKTVNNPDELLEQQSMKIDELRLPAEVYRTLYSDIKSSTQLLPAAAQKFQDWAVGLLER